MTPFRPQRIPWPTARRSVGCASSTRPPAPSWGRRFSPRAFGSQVDPWATQRVLRRLCAPLGAARGVADRQRDALGFAGRPVHRPGVLAGGSGCGPADQPAASAAAQRRDRALPGCRQVVGGAGELRLGSRVATAPGQAGPLAAGAVSHGRWAPRCSVYPGLKHSGRRYDPAREAARWDLRRAWEFVGSHLVPRLVDSQRKVSLCNRPYSVG